MLSDHEQRALDELERRYAAEAQEPVPPGRGPRTSPRRSDRPPGFRVLLVLGCLGVALVVAGAPAAGFAVALATAIGWLFWRLWSHRTADGSIPTPPSVDGPSPESASERRPGESLRRYLAWLAEAAR